jgi:hypothetical protein
MATLDDTAAPVAEKSVESSASAVEWAAIFGGGLAALGGDRYPFDTRSGPRVDHGFSMVVQPIHRRRLLGQRLRYGW